MQPYSLYELLESFQKHSDSVVLYLPRTSDLKQLAWQGTTDSKITVIHYCMEGASKVSGIIQYLIVTDRWDCSTKTAAGSLCLHWGIQICLTEKQRIDGWCDQLNDMVSKSVDFR